MSSDELHRECGTQAGSYNIRPIANAVVELLEKSQEVHEVFKSCQRELEQSRGTIDKSEIELAKLNRTVDGFSEAMDSLATGRLQENMFMLKANGHIDRLKKEIGTASCLLNFPFFVFVCNSNGELKLS